MPGKHLFGNSDKRRCYHSSLVIDNLCDGGRGDNATIACFYFDFAARKESPQ